jgi:outer membrane lipoprotein-sorting protein
MLRTFITLIIVGCLVYGISNLWVESHNEHISSYIEGIDKNIETYSDSASFYQRQIDQSYRGKGLYKGEKLRSVIYNRDRCIFKVNRYVVRRNELAKTLF